jgi:acetate kinase
MEGAILVLNAGSSSIKFTLFADRGGLLDPVMRGQTESLFTAPRFEATNGTGVTIAGETWPQGTRLGHQGALEHLVGVLQHHRGGRELRAVGHRVVHGGTQFAAPVRVDEAVLTALEQLVPLAPLHQPHNLAPIRALLASRPALPQVACFDTAFHRTQPPLEQAFALPPEITERGVRRYGFHGLSYAHIASVLPQLDARAARGRCVVLHLGNGASMCALERGISVASTMGFTALDGLPMGTRCGSIDPGVILYLMNERGMDARAIEKLLYHQSGLLGVSGESSDMRSLLESNEPRAHLAVDLFVYRIGRELGSLAAVLGGLDALVFTGGIGERSAAIRARVCRHAAWLGLKLDAAANLGHGPRISAGTSRVSAWVIAANEELMIATQTADALATEAA